MAASLHPLRLGSIIRCTPAITLSPGVNVDENVTAFDQKAADPICFDISVSETTVNLHSSQDSYWRSFLQQDFVIVQGFPVPRRPDSYTGIELPASVLLDNLGDWRIVIRPGRCLLSGSRRTLELVQTSDNVLLWHEITGFRKRRCCHTNYGSDHNHERAFEDNLDDFKTKRHILGRCEELNINEDGR